MKIENKESKADIRGICKLAMKYILPFLLRDFHCLNVACYDLICEMFDGIIYLREPNSLEFSSSRRQ